MMFHRSSADRTKRGYSNVAPKLGVFPRFRARLNRARASAQRTDLLAQCIQETAIGHHTREDFLAQEGLALWIDHLFCSPPSRGSSPWSRPYTRPRI